MRAIILYIIFLYFNYRIIIANIAKKAKNIKSRSMLRLGNVTPRNSQTMTKKKRQTANMPKIFLQSILTSENQRYKFFSINPGNDAKIAKRLKS